MFLIHECDVYMCAKHMNLALMCVRLMMTLHSLSLNVLMLWYLLYLLYTNIDVMLLLHFL